MPCKDRAGLAPSEADAALLIERLSCIPAHADVPPALAELKKRYRLAAISNTDDDLIAGSLPSLGLGLDAVITAQQARAYKPDLRLFRHAHAVLGVTPREVVPVAASQPLDMAVCRTLGFRAFWVNRRGETAEAQYLLSQRSPASTRWRGSSRRRTPHSRAPRRSGGGRRGREESRREC